MVPYGVCTLKYQYEVEPAQAYKSLNPEYWYRPADVLDWPNWSGGAQSQQCKAFTSGGCCLHLWLLPCFEPVGRLPHAELCHSQCDCMLLILPGKLCAAVP